MPCFNLSVTYAVNNGQVQLAVTRSAYSELYADHIRYAWTALEGEWRTWDPQIGDWQTWNPDTAVWHKVEDHGWLEPNLSMTLRFTVPAHLRRKLLAFRLLPDGESRIAWIYTAVPMKLYYWTEKRRKETLLFLKSEGGTLDARLLYLRRKRDSFRYPLPFQRIGGTDAQICSLASDFGEPELCLDETDPGALTLTIRREKYH